ncbi:MAG: hypothetical protein ABI912_04505 [Actinomycetota bacterium]
MSGEPTQESQWRDEFERIVNVSYRDRRQPVGPYMRWPLGAALALLWTQVAVSVLEALVAGSLLTGGHSDSVSTGALLWTLASATAVAIVLGWSAYNMRLRLLPALYIAFGVEAIEVAGRAVAVLTRSNVQLGDYFGLAWAVAAVAVLAVPSSRAYCTRRRTRGLVND